MASNDNDNNINTRPALLAAARSFADAFANKSFSSAGDLVSRFFASSSQILAIEHGLLHCSPAPTAKQNLPFLGVPFVGKDGVEKYFELVGETLDYGDMSFDSDFPSASHSTTTTTTTTTTAGDGGDGGIPFPNFVVDVESRQVCVKGRARFTCRATGQSWDERFIWKVGYVIEDDVDVDADGGDDVDGKKEKKKKKQAWKVVRYEVWADPAAAYLATRGEL